MKRRIRQLIFSASLLVFGLLSSPVFAAQQGQGRPKPPTFFEFLLRPKFIVMLILGAVALFLLPHEIRNSHRLLQVVRRLRPQIVLLKKPVEVDRLSEPPSRNRCALAELREIATNMPVTAYPSHRFRFCFMGRAKHGTLLQGKQNRPIIRHPDGDIIAKMRSTASPSILCLFHPDE